MLLGLLSDSFLVLGLWVPQHFNVVLDGFALESLDCVKNLIDPIKMILRQIFEAGKFGAVAKWLINSLGVFVIVLVGILLSL